MEFYWLFYYPKNEHWPKPSDRFRIPCDKSISMVLSKYLCLIFSTIFTFNLTLTEKSGSSPALHILRIRNEHAKSSLRERMCVSVCVRQL